MTFQRTQNRPHIAFNAQGEGDAVLFLHGIGGNRGNWDDQIARFSQAYRAIALDFRGYGDSDAIEGAFKFADFVDDALSVLDELHIERTHVVGLSMGGLIAQALYARAPARVISLGLVACRSAAEPLLPKTRRDTFIRDRLEPLRTGGPEALALALAPSLMGQHATSKARELVMASLRKVRPDSYLRVMEARMSVPPFLNPSTIKVPTLVVGSEEDQVAPLQQVRELANAITGAGLLVIEGAGHLINLEKPKQFNSGLLEFLHSVTTDSQSTELGERR